MEVKLRIDACALTGITIRKNISIDDRRTTIVLEPPVWDGLLDICRLEGLSLYALFKIIVRRRESASMSLMLRTTLLEYYRGLTEV
jgi:predicted DNA-binding ribbon-helix-helix protein